MEKMNTDKPIDLIRCGICQADSSSVLELLIHKADHAGPKLGVSCELCGTGFTRRKTLLDHYRVKHRVITKPKTIQEHCAKNEEKRQSEGGGKNSQVKVTKKGRGRRSGGKTKTNLNTKDANEDRGGEVSTSVDSSKGEGSISQCNLQSTCSVITQGSNVVAPGLDVPVNVTLGTNVVTSTGNIQTFIGKVSTDSKDEQIDRSLLLQEQDKEYDAYKDANDDGKLDTTTDSAGNTQSVTISISCPSASYCPSVTPEESVVDKEGMEMTLQDDENSPLSNMPAEGSINQKWVEPGVTVVTKIIQGNSFQYGKDMYQCNQCEFASQCREVMSNHLEVQHGYTESSPTMRNILANQDQKIQSNKKRDSEANIQKTRRPRIRKVEKQDLIGHYVCNKCNKEFSRLRYLRKHLLTHKTDQDFLCDECGKHFKTRTYLTAHRKTHNKKTFECRQCSFTSDNAFAIHAHRQIHSEGSIICDICGFAYSDRSTLIKHKRVHDMSRPFPCSYPGCTWRFENEPSCLAHVRGHSNIQGKFKCSKCGYAFRHKHHLKRHESKMHGLMPSKVVHADLCDDSLTANHVQEVIIGEAVKILVDGTDASGDVQIGHALQPGNIVITTDSEGNAINYHVTDIEVSTGCDAVLDQDKNTDITVSLCKTDGHTTQLQENYVPLNITEELLTDIENEESISRDLHISSTV